MLRQWQHSATQILIAQSTIPMKVHIPNTTSFQVAARVMADGSTISMVENRTETERAMARQQHNLLATQFHNFHGWQETGPTAASLAATSSRGQTAVSQFPHPYRNIP